MSTLKTNLDNIYIELNSKLIPENIKQGITILGVTGTYNGETSSEIVEEV